VSRQARDALKAGLDQAKLLTLAAMDNSYDAPGTACHGPPARKRDAILALRNGPAVTQGKRTHASFLHTGLLARPGLEALRHIHTGRSPQPPIHHLSGRMLVARRSPRPAASFTPASGTRSPKGW
jgi:hypothetical protein